MAMEPIRFDTKSRLAYDAIKAAIIEGNYLPGQKVGISQIAKELNTSDIPVREAMQRLEAEGWLEYTPHVGFKVTGPDFDKYTDVYAVRQLLEGEAARRAAENISNDSLNELRSLQEEMRTAAKNAAYVSFSDLNRRFHAVIFAASDNAVLIRQIEQVGAIYPRTHAIFVLHPERTVSALREHDEILQCLERRDSEGTKKVYLEHMARGYEILLKLNKIPPDKKTDMWVYA
jgi:DNA-binding GntR family transcriptional regulator